MALGAVQWVIQILQAVCVIWRTACFLFFLFGGEIITKIKEKASVSKNAKGKIQAAPKELLRRGLLTGTEKLNGQLRDAAEGGPSGRSEPVQVKAKDAVRRSLSTECRHTNPAGFELFQVKTKDICVQRQMPHTSQQDRQNYLQERLTGNAAGETLPDGRRRIKETRLGAKAVGRTSRQAVKGAELLHQHCPG